MIWRRRIDIDGAMPRRQRGRAKGDNYSMTDFGGLGPNQGFQIPGRAALVSDASHGSSLRVTKLLRNPRTETLFLVYGTGYAILYRKPSARNYCGLVARKVALLLTFFFPGLFSFFPWFHIISAFVGSF